MSTYLRRRRHQWRISNRWLVRRGSRPLSFAAWLLESILNPNAEIAPEYLPRMITLKDGATFTGIRLRSSTAEAMRDTNGRNRRFQRDDIVSMQELQMSFMPPGLPFAMTDRELRDLMAFLERGTLERLK